MPPYSAETPGSEPVLGRDRAFRRNTVTSRRKPDACRTLAAEAVLWEHVTFAQVGFALFQYAVKFICGKSEGDVAAPGIYFTAINVHNPTDDAVGFRKKVAVAFPWERPGPVSRFFDAKLGPDQALEIDCPDIVEHSEVKRTFSRDSW
jgi:hypothetical protein